MEKDIENDNGLNETYYPSEKIQKRFYKEKGVKEGVFMQWHENGKLYIESSYKNGKPIGKIKFYDENGQLRKEYTQKMGEHHGVLKKWRKNNTLEEQMLKHKTIKLTKEILEKLIIHDVIYAEIADGGAMGNAGGIIIYLIKGEQLICYETNQLINVDMGSKLRKIFSTHWNRFNLIYGEHIFDYYYGGAGNHVAININVSLIESDGFFLYERDKKVYQISPYSKAIFNGVIKLWKNSKKNITQSTH